jgi:ABC-type uncharacterized transport system ATPase subunit
VRSLHFGIPSGEVFGFLGINGAGKTTTLKILSGEDIPTSGTARFSSPLGVYDFQKRSSLIEVSEQGAQVLGQIASVLAHGEGLQAHARAAEMRLIPKI